MSSEYSDTKQKSKTKTEQFRPETKYGEAAITAAEAAKEYLGLGIAVHPVKSREKKPYYNWKGYKFPLDALKDLFPDPTNIGVQLGTPSDGLIDIDLDWPETRVVADFVVPEMPSFGRPGSPRSHRLLYISDASKVEGFEISKKVATALGINLADTHACKVVELRGTGGQTIFPPGIHESGEPIAWTQGDTAENIARARKNAYTFASAKRKVGLIGFLAVMLRYYPGEGARDEFCMAVTGALIKAGYDEDDVRLYVHQLAKAAGDDEADKRKKARRTANNYVSGNPITGLSKACELAGIEALRPTLRKWLAIPKTEEELEFERLASLNRADYARERGKAAGSLGLDVKTLDAYVQLARDERQAELHPEYMMSGEDATAFMNQRHAIISDIGSKTRILSYRYDDKFQKPVPIYQTRADILIRYQNRRVIGSRSSAAEYWLSDEHRDQFDTVFFDPEMPSVHDNNLNLWTGFDVAPIPGDWSLLKEHIRLIVCKGNQSHYEYVIKWLAWKVQNPGKRPRKTIVVRGQKGTGKSLPFNEFRLLWGQHGLRIYGRDHLVKNFNAHLQNIAFILADEAYFAGDVKHESTLKAIITDDTLQIEPKGVNAFQVKNCIGIIMTTNEDWAVPVTDDERRFWVIEASDQYAKSKASEEDRKKYFGDILTQMQNGGRQAMLFELQTMKLGAFDPEYDAPDTEETSEQALLGLKAHEKALLEALEDGYLLGHRRGENDTIRVKDFIAFSGARSPKLLEMSERKVTMLFRKIGAKTKIINGYPHWVFPSLQKSRANWDKLYGKYDWPTEHEEWSDRPGSI